MNEQSLMDAVHKVWNSRETYIHAMEHGGNGNGVENVMRLILELTEGKPQKRNAAGADL